MTTLHSQTAFFHSPSNSPSVNKIQATINMNIVKINSLAEIDNIIALLLGWVESEIEEECSQFTPGATWIYGGDYYAIKVKLLFPEEVVNAGGESEWTYEHEDWYENGGAPYFSSLGRDTNILLEECDRVAAPLEHRMGLVLEWFRNKDNIGCQIQKYEFKKPESLIPVVAYTGTNFNIPRINESCNLYGMSVVARHQN